MSYDADKTTEILDELKSALRKDDRAEAMQILRFADASGAIRRGSGMFSALQKSIGERQAQQLVYDFATDRCPYCKGGREKCEDCGGKGFYSGTKVCHPCAGLGLKRCPFCNGTAFAGYDFVPRGLRQIVLLVRTDFAAEQLKSLCNPEASKSERASLFLARLLFFHSSLSSDLGFRGRLLIFTRFLFARATRRPSLLNGLQSRETSTPHSSVSVAANASHALRSRSLPMAS